MPRPSEPSAGRTRQPTRRRRRILIALVVVFGALVATWTALRPGSRGRASSAARPNVLLIVADTLRADRLGSHGSALGATPQLDAFATESTRFARAYAHAPWTLPAFASLFTSLSPPQHGAGGRLGEFRGLRPDVRTVAEVFHDAGYATAEITNIDFLAERFGMTQGFKHVDFVPTDNVEGRRATQTTDAALRWLRSARTQPFFLFVHYFDPHLTYDPPADFRQRFAAPEDHGDTRWLFGTVPQMIAYRQGKLSIDAPTIRRAERLYNGEVAFTDAEVGRLIAALREMQLADSTIIVFTADHGEEFLDHGGFEHGHTLYEELVHVPLLIRYPGHLTPGVAASVVRHIDVAPTLCALAGIQPDPMFAGQNLLDVVGIDPPLDRPVLFEGNFWGPPYRGWLHDGYKLIIDPDQNVALFSIGEDPGETSDLSGTAADRLRTAQADLDLALKELHGPSGADAAPLQLTPEETRRLRSLGYLR
ncbi:MAG: sulfatase [Phycisphaerae bacterium]|nr:sulfatase [Phycisphaerae bacterium]